MSLTSKLVFTLSCITTASIVVYVHYRQFFDKEQLHLGVIRDRERLERRKRENIYVLEQQIRLGSELKRLEEERNS